MPMFPPKAKDHARRFWRDRRGAAGVEFALTAPILIAIFAVAIDLGRAIYDDMSLASAARAGVQYARARPDDIAGAKATALGGGGLSAEAAVETATFCECPSGEAADCTDSCPDGPLFTFVSVSVSQPYRPIFPYPGVPGEILLQKQAVLRAS
ncbi:TadE/TadG family type IV pilus assembly protein [Azospirillum soli]|uniref:TadE/TadG family type IV pilus assembly protein n=1 Tax=Azospirillum soli TaxID=1304799 RepID=UPI001AE74942|nr:TadE/TadG family type IV pilus assembly protein [Azospirillum soli]MBP2314989.1 Flp pilus assembly pilin Flp [Azospirillum soli]